MTETVFEQQVCSINFHFFCSFFEQEHIALLRVLILFVCLSLFAPRIYIYIDFFHSFFVWLIRALFFFIFHSFSFPPSLLEIYIYLFLSFSETCSQVQQRSVFTTQIQFIRGTSMQSHPDGSLLSLMPSLPPCPIFVHECKTKTSSEEDFLSSWFSFPRVLFSYRCIGLNPTAL